MQTRSAYHRLILNETNGDLLCCTASARAGVHGTNPVAGDDAFTFAGGADLTVDASGVLTNDWDGDYHPEYESKGNSPTDPLSAQLVTETDHGALTLSPDGSFSNPTAGYSGADGFTYTLYGALGISTTAQVKLVISTLTTPNQAPVAVNDLFTTTKGVAVTVDLRANDSDPDGDSLTVIILTQPTHGTATVSNNQVSYAPSAGFSGNDSFPYRVSDGKGGSATATVTVTVSEGASTDQRIYLPVVSR